MYTWALIGVATLLVFATGNFTMLAASVLGFVVMGMLFMGMMNVLPIAISHPSHPAAEAAAVPAPSKPAVSQTAYQESVRPVLKSA
jgi:hypothetical protein